MNLQFHISFVPKWRGIELLRGAVDSILKADEMDQDTRSAISMVSIELMENAYKHSQTKDATIDYALDIHGDDIDISVSNPIAETASANIQALRETVDWIYTFDSPLDAYIDRMKSLYDSEDAGASGLGLVRIVYEGQVKLSYDIDSANSRLLVKTHFLPREDKNLS